MKDARILHLRIRATADNRMSAGAFRLYVRILDWRYQTRYAPADAEFGISWRELAFWYDNNSEESISDKQTIYAWLRELVLCGYLFYNGRKGCPAKGCYRLNCNPPDPYLPLFDWGGISLLPQRLGVGGKTRQLDGGKTRQLDGGKTRHAVGGKNRPPINSYSLREEMYKTKGKKLSSLRSEVRGEVSSSLRSKMNPPLAPDDGQDASAVPKKQSHVEGRALSSPDNPSATSGTGGTIPPGRGRKAPADSPTDYVLIMARSYIEQKHLEMLEHRHVEALLKAGEKIPLVIIEKFSDLCEAHNPLPG